MSRLLSRSRTLLVALVVATVLVAPLTALPVAASSHTAVSIGPGGPSAAQTGDTVTLPVTATASNVSGYQANLTFDPDAVQVEDVNGSAAFDDPVYTIDNEAGWVAFNDLRSDGVDDPVLASIVVNVTASSGTAELDFVEDDTKLTNATPGEIAIGNFTGAVVEVDNTAPTVSNFSVANPGDQDLEIAFESDESLADIDIGLSDGTNLTRGDFAETEDNGTFAYETTHTVGSGGDYTATLVTAADAAGNDGATGQNDSVTGVPDADTDDDGGDSGGGGSSSSGGSSGGGGGGATDFSLTTTKLSADQVRVTVENAKRVVPFTAHLPAMDGDTGASTQLTTLRMTPGGASDFELLIDRRDGPPAGTPSLADETGQSGLATFTVDHELSDDEVARARLTFGVSKSALDAWGADPASVTLYRYEDGGWAAYDTELVREDAGTYYFAADFPGLSTFAVGADRTATPTPTTTEPVTTTPPPTTQSTPTTGTSSPTTDAPIASVEQAGLPVLPILAIAAVVVLVVGIVLYRRRNTGGGRL